MKLWQGARVSHPKWGNGYVVLSKVGNGVKVKFYRWPCPFIVKPEDLKSGYMK